MVLFHLDERTELQQLIQSWFITVPWSAVIRDAGGVDQTVVVKSASRAIRESNWELFQRNSYGQMVLFLMFDQWWRIIVTRMNADVAWCSLQRNSDLR